MIYSLFTHGKEMGWSTSTTELAVLVILTVVSVEIIRGIVQIRFDSERKGCPLPPGPTRLAVWGSVLSSNSLSKWLRFTEWRAKYGDIIYFDLFGTDSVVLNSTSVARELLEKRSQIYCDRPFMMTVVAPYYDFNLAFLRYGEHWRLCRRIFHRSFRPDAALRFRPMQLRKARELIVKMIDNPDEYPAHLSTFSIGIALSAGYDYEPVPQNDPMLSIVDTFVRFSVPALAPEKVLLVMALPFLQHIPDWLPGSWFKRQANAAHAWRDKMLETPYRHAQERMESKDHLNASMISDHINEAGESGGSYRSESGTPLKDASATSLSAFVNTTASTLMVFLLAMVENPRVWKRAQADIDAVVGMGRLPEFDDRPSLPYVDAILREVLRWRPVFPLGGLHAARQSDIYEGYYLPKGTVVVANVWAISRDEARYPDGDEFMPERFLNAEGMLIDDDPSDFVFGFGRRICPGRHMVDASLWGSIATMLATLDFNLAKDADGNNIVFKATFRWELARQPNPFPCRITPRSHISKEVIDRVLSK